MGSDLHMCDSAKKEVIHVKISIILCGFKTTFKISAATFCRYNIASYSERDFIGFKVLDENGTLYSLFEHFEV